MYVFYNIKGAGWALELSILMLKEWRKIRHGYMYAIRTYNHGTFKNKNIVISGKSLV